MSHSTIGSDDGGRRRRRRPDAEGSARGVAGAGARRTPRDEEANAAGSAPTPLLERCRREGREAARRGSFDSVMLTDEGLLPRLAELASERDQRCRGLARRAAAARQAAERAAGQARAESAAAEAAVRRTAEVRDEHTEQLEITREQLDRLAARAARDQRARNALARWTEARRGGAPRRAAPPGPPDHNGDAERSRDAGNAGDTGDAEREGLAEHEGFAAAEPAGDPAARRARWEGATSESAMSRWGTVALLVCLALVELPIYWSVFRRLHGVGDATSNLLTATFTFAVGTIMIVVPHVLGRLLNRIPATGAPRLLALPGLALLGAWAYACWVLGDLRTSLLAEEPEPYVADPEYQDAIDQEQLGRESVLAELDVGEQTMSLMFVALLLLSGGVAFLLGIGRAHPFLAAYRDTFRRRERLDAAEREAVLAARRTGQLADGHPAESEARQEAHDAALLEVIDLYEAAAHAYVDGVASGSGDPAVTEAAMRLSGRWPLLPLPARRLSDWRNG
ncbi:hypothetical protein [Streptomyces sp. B6B3]|uniref:hypothetical protein n=1 Tax=Streptomyces sp. B6B3 TaxID=3153570 RepID=UPI00325E3875